jgi:hypothetical protein
MKKYTITLWALLLTAAFFLTNAQAQLMATANAVVQEAAAKAQMGKVVAVDTAKNELAVKDEKGVEKTMAVSPNTKITKEGKEIALSEIKAGDRVLYEMDASADSPVAKSLTVLSMKAAKP